MFRWRASAVITTAVAASGLLFAILLLQQGPDTLRSIVLAYALFAIPVAGTLAWNRAFRPPPQTVAMQMQLLPILFVALTIRLIASHSPGFDFDLAINKGWARSAAQLGLARSFTEQVAGNVLPNYPPLIITLYWLTGTLYQFAISPLFDPLLADYSVVIRFPAIACDLLACVAVAVIVRRLKVEQWALAALVYALHPVVIYDTGIWGQTDGIYALWMLLALYTLARGRWFWAGVFTACAVLTKPQVAAMLPVLLVVLVRYLPRSASFAGGAAMAGMALLAPFIAGGVAEAVLAVYQQSIGGYYKAIGIGAYNLWEIPPGIAVLSDETFAFAHVTYRSAGLLLFAAATLLVLWRLREALLFPRTERQHLTGILLAGALTTSAMFLFCTEMHERYQFAFVLLALPVAAASGAGAILYATTSCLILLNLLGEFPVGSWDAALFEMAPALRQIIAVSQLVVFFVTVGLAPKLAATESAPPR